MTSTRLRLSFVPRADQIGRYLELRKLFGNHHPDLLNLSVELQNKLDEVLDRYHIPKKPS